MSIIVYINYIFFFTFTNQTFCSRINAGDTGTKCPKTEFLKAFKRLFTDTIAYRYGCLCSTIRIRYIVTDFVKYRLGLAARDVFTIEVKSTIYDIIPDLPAYQYYDYLTIVWWSLVFVSG